MIYLVRNIKEISREKITYCDNDNIEHELSLFECSKNWVEYFNNSGDFATWNGSPAPKITVEENKCVGERDWFAEKPYFEFFSNPRTRFEIHLEKRFMDKFYKYWKDRYYREFKKICLDLAEVGWSTFDLG